MWLTREGKADTIAARTGRLSLSSPVAGWQAAGRNTRRAAAETTDIWIYDVDGCKGRHAPHVQRAEHDAGVDVGRATPGVQCVRPRTVAAVHQEHGWQRESAASAEGANVRFPYAWFDRNTKLVFTEIRAGQLDIGMVDKQSAGIGCCCPRRPTKLVQMSHPTGAGWPIRRTSRGRDEIFVRPMDDVESSEVAGLD